MGSKRIMDIIGITFSTVGVCILQQGENKSIVGICLNV